MYKHPQVPKFENHPEKAICMIITMSPEKMPRNFLEDKQ